ncbi:MAG: CCA tRNA nucleotidyltransferase [Deltaproteobacteria bacterium]|nr:CCA tRNA nucleotidyltransferase [Deltaproteobacteria bacterium]
MTATDRRYRDAVKAMQSLERAGFTTRLAGGCVRDRILGKVPYDYDLATTATPDVVMAHFRAEKLSTIPTGVDHGTVTLVMPSGPIEITTLRKDVATDGRRAEVQFGSSFADDAARRDFTINALFEDSAGKIDDFVGGQADLSQGILRFVGDPRTRISEDYLRILRLFRFWATLGFRPDAATLRAVGEGKEGLRRISQERITQEWIKMCSGKTLDAALDAMVAAGVFAVILPEVTPVRLPPARDLQAWQTPVLPAIGVLAGLCLADGVHDAKRLQAIGERMRLSRTDTRVLVFFATAREVLIGTQVKDIADKLIFVDSCEHVAGQGSLTAVFAPVLDAFAECKQMLDEICAAENQYGHRRKAVLPINGRDLGKHLNLTEGPELGRQLTRLKRAYYNGLWQTKDEGLQLIAST